jgi:hypothetical protein
MDLTQESFDRLLSWLHSDPGEAGKIYVKIRSDLSRHFSSQGCLAADKHADITIDRVAKKLPEVIETYVGDPEPYFYGVAYYVLKECFAKHTNEVELTDDLSLRTHDDDDDVELEFECLEKCIEGLTPQKQYLIRNYYRGDKKTKIRRRTELASTFSLELPVLRVQALRIRQDLRSCIINCLQAEGQETGTRS